MYFLFKSRSCGLDSTSLLVMMFCCMAVVHFEVQKELKATDDVRSVLLTVILKANENTLSVSGCC